MKIINTNLIAQNIAPYAVNHVGVFNSDGEKVGKISLNDLKPEFPQRLYRFGILSDVHRQTNQATENAEDLQRALTIYNGREDVEFTVICGDISQYGTESDFNLYKSSVDTYSADTPVYTTSGNHDCGTSGHSINNETWVNIVGTQKTFEFEAHGDHFLFLGMDKYSLGSNGAPYTQEDITWLANKLNAYRYCRCFIITHLFFPDYSGNFKHIYPTGNWLGGSQLTQLKALIDQYPNTVWFNGHSHWMWHLQEFEQKANIYKAENGGWAVHIPSCASPIDSDGVSTRVEQNLKSEGAIIDVYEDYIDIRGINLKDDKYLPIAQYRLPIEVPEETPDGFTKFTSESFRLGGFTANIIDGLECNFDEHTNTLQVTFTQKSQKILMPEISGPYQIKFDTVTYTPESTPTTAKEYVGFYEGSKYSVDMTKTYVADPVQNYDGYSGTCGQFNISSKYENNGGTYPCTITITGLKYKLAE